MALRALRAASALALLALLALPPAWGAAPRDPAAEPGGRPARGGVSGKVTIEIEPGGEDPEEDVDPLTGVVNFNLSRDVTVEEGQVHNDDLVLVGGNATVLGEVRGDVVVIRGALDLQGRVKGDVVAILTDTTVGDEARIGGDLVHLGGSFEASPEAKIGGQTFHADLPSFAFGEGARHVAGSALGVVYLIKVLLFAILFWAMLIIVCVAPRRVTDAGEALGELWGRALFVGLLAYAAYFVLFGIFLMLCLVLIGVPLLALLVFAWFVVKAMGMASILWLVGDRLVRSVHPSRDVTPLVGFLAGFLVYLPTQIIPFQLGLVWLTLGLLGNVLATCATVLAVGLTLVAQFGPSGPFAPQRSGAAAPSRPISL